MSYARFATAMARFGYDWKAHEVVTEDNYILTTFQVLGQTGVASESADKGSVIFQHGAFMDGAAWIGASQDSKPFMLQLADDGYDVWIGSNRGTEYSQGHKTLNAKDDSEYWNFSWAEMGLYDDTANIRKMQEVSNVEKVYYVGYSQGTIQMLYGLAHRENEFFADSLHKAVFFAPCFMGDWDHCTTVECVNEA